MRIFLWLAICGFAAIACSDDPADGPDAGASPDVFEGHDAGMLPDARPDAGRIDGGRRDVGFDDPATIIQGIEQIEGLETFVKVQGTLTSTLPPVFLLPTGPQLSHEY